MSGPNAPNLLALLRSGSRESLADLYDHLGPRIFALAAAIVGEADAEEVVTDTFMQVWNDRDTFDEGRGSVGAWVVTIARSRALDRRRRQRRRTDIRDDVGDGHFRFVEEPEDPAAQAIVRTDAERLLGRGLAQLPPEQLKVIELAYFGGYTQSEIARATDTPLGTVKTRMRTAMRKLRESLTATGKEGE